MRTLTITTIIIATLAISGCGNKKPTKFEPMGGGNCRDSQGRVVHAFDQKECETLYGGTWMGD